MARRKSLSLFGGKRRKKSFLERAIDGLIKGSTSETKRIQDSIWPEFAYVGKKKKK